MSLSIYQIASHSRDGFLAQHHQPCLDCVHHTWATVFGELARNVKLNPYTDIDVAVDQSLEITMKMAQESAVDATEVECSTFAYITVDFIFTPNGWAVTDLGGTNGYGLCTLHPAARQLIYGAVHARLCDGKRRATNISTEPLVLAVPYASDHTETLTDKILTAAALHCFEAHGPSNRRGAIVTPSNISHLPNSTSILVGPCDRVLPHIEMRKANLAIGGRRLRSLYDLIALRMPFLRKRLLTLENDYIFQWPDFASALRGSIVNETYEITCNPWNVRCAVRRALPKLKGICDIEAEVAKNPNQLRSILLHQEHKCVILKAPSSKSQGTLHVYRDDAQTKPDHVINLLCSKLDEAYGLGEVAAYPVTVSQCVEHRDTYRNGNVERYFDARFIVVADPYERKIKAYPAFARHLIIPNVTRCANEAFCCLPSELRTHHLPLANEESLQQMQLDIRDLRQLSSDAAIIGRQVAVDQLGLSRGNN